MVVLANALRIMVSLLLLVPVSLLAADFQIMSKKGKIQILRLGEVEWRVPEGKTLAHGTLLSVGPGSFIELAHSDPGIVGKERVRVEANMVIRLDETLIKKMNFQEYPLTRLLSGSKSELAPVKDKPIMSLADALTRYLLSYDRQDEQITARQSDPEKNEVQTASEIEKIEILSPSHDSLLFLEKSQAETSLRWIKNSKVKTYRVYLWKEGTARGPHLLTTEATHARISFKNEGKYLMMVSNEDRSIRSDTIRIYVEKMREDSDARRKFLSSVLRREKFGLEPIYPKANTEFYGHVKDEPVVFAWIDSDGLAADEEYLLSLLSESGKILKSRTQLQRISVMLNSGEYRWRVQRVQRSTGEVKKDTGDLRLLKLSAYSSEQWLASIGAALKTKVPDRRVLVLDLK